MADRYFDRNGATAGFGTLTGNWDTTTASWSTSSAGNVAAAAFTFTNADRAFFGNVGTTGTAGTATIINGLTVNLNSLRFGLAGAQTIAASGTGNLRFSGTFPSIANAGSGQPIISAPINFTNGIIFDLYTAGGAATSIQVNGVGQSANSGIISIRDGTVVLLSTGAGTPDAFKGATRIELTPYAIASANSTPSLQYYGSNAYTEPAQLVAYSENSGIYSHNNGGVTLSHSSVGTYIGRFGALAYLASTLTGKQIFNTAPVSASQFYLQSSGLTTSQTGVAPSLVFNHSSNNSTITGDIYLYTGQASTSAAGVNYVLEQNSSGLVTIFSGDVLSQSGSNATAFAWLHLRGSSSGYSGLHGNYVATTGTNGLRKTGTCTWSIVGTNTFTGSVLIEQGRLEAGSNNALGAAAGVASTIGASGQLRLLNGISLDKSSTDFSIVNTSNPIQSSNGTNTFRVKNLSLAASNITTFSVSTGEDLVLSVENGGVISGSGSALAKDGAGKLTLSDSSNTFSGTVYINSGTLEVSSLNNSGLPGVLGTSTSALEFYGTLRFVGGSPASTDRLINPKGASPALEAAGVGAVTYQSVTYQDGSVLNLTGTSTANNTISASFPAGVKDGFGISKQDTGFWRLTGGLYFDAPSTVSQGTLRVETTNSNGITSALTVSSGAVLELATDTLPESAPGAGTVLGSGPLTVSGTVRTRGGIVQKGQVRHGGDLTFEANSILRVGAAA